MLLRRAARLTITLATLATSCSTRHGLPQPSNPAAPRETLLEAARLAGQAGDYATCRRGYEALLAADLHDDEARAGLARLDAWEGAYARAEAAYRDVLLRHPTDDDVRAGLFDVLVWAERWDDADAVLAEAPPTHRPILLGRRARLAYLQGNVTEAQRLLAQAERIAPNDAEIAVEKARLVTQWARVTSRMITSSNGAPILGQTELSLSQAVHRLRISFESEQGSRATSFASGWAYGATYGLAGAWTFAPGWTWEVKAALGAPAMMVPVLRLDTQLAMAIRPRWSSSIGYSFRRFADGIDTHGGRASLGFTFRDELRLDATYWLTQVRMRTATHDASSRQVQAFGLSAGRTLFPWMAVRAGYAHGAEAERSPAVFQLLDLVNDSFYVGIRFTPSMFVSIEPVYTLVLRGRPGQPRQVQHSVELGLAVRR